jgi:glycosyltransferase involved in cell wall biosynthesis
MSGMGSTAQGTTGCACGLHGALSVVCFGGGDWWYHNRGHFDMQVMRRYGRVGRAVYVNSITARKPRLGEGRRLVRCVARKVKSLRQGLRHVEHGFYVYTPFVLPVHHLRWARGGNNWVLRQQVERVAGRLGMARPVVWVTCPTACEAAVGLRRSALVYQRTDRFEEFPNVDVGLIRGYDRRLKEAADLTVYVNRLLYEEERGACRRALLADHGVDFEHFAGEGNGGGAPGDLGGIAGPVAGFFGGIDGHTFDLALMEEVVGRLPQVTFVFVGRASIDCGRLRSLPNVRMLGQKAYEEVPDYGRRFDVCLMPWRQNRWIEACNPIKLKEYLALGKPVVSTPFSELARYDGQVYRAEEAGAFAAAIERALAEDSESKRAARRESVRGQSWDAVAAQIMAGVEQAIAGARL